MRLNRGAITLNYQELRNCMYRGRLNDVAKELCAENTAFLRILRQKKPHPRYLDAEFIIRYFAFSDNVRKDADGDAYLNGYRGKIVTVCSPLLSYLRYILYVFIIDNFILE